MLKNRKLLSLLYFLEIGLASGRTWTSVFRTMSQEHEDAETRLYCKAVIQGCEHSGAASYLHLMKEREKRIEIKVFYEVLLFCEQSSRDSKQMIQNFRQLMYQVDLLEKKRNSMLYTSKLQAVTALVVSGFLSLILPRLFPDLTPSFVELGRQDLFVLGWLGLLVGMLILIFLVYLPSRRQSLELQFILFLYVNSILLSSGLDFKSAWTQSARAFRFPKMWRRELVKLDQSLLKFEDYLLSLARKLSEPWREFLFGLSWTMSSGGPLGDYLKDSANAYRETKLIDWEEQLKKASFLALLPLYLICLPSSLFLFMGPLLLGFAV